MVSKSSEEDAVACGSGRRNIQPVCRSVVFGSFTFRGDNPARSPGAFSGMIRKGEAESRSPSSRRITGRDEALAGLAQQTAAWAPAEGLKPLEGGEALRRHAAGVGQPTRELATKLETRHIFKPE